MAGVFAHNGGTFKEVGTIPVKNGGSWENAKEVWVKDNGVWVKVFPNLIREPASGEAFQAFVTMWYYNGVNHYIRWMSASIYSGPPPSATVTVVGTWTYYRGSYAGNYGDESHRLYRIGRY